MDGDNLRHGLNSDLGFGDDDRRENMRRTAEVAALFADSGVVAVVSLISPFAAERRRAKEIHAERGLPFYEIFVDTPLDVCESRDPKGHYAKARAGALPAFTGIANDYQPPANAELTIDTSTRSVADGAEAIERLLAETGVLFGDLDDLAANI